MKTIEYCVQQLSPLVGRYVAENENTSAYRSEPAAAPPAQGDASSSPRPVTNVPGPLAPIFEDK